MEDTLAAPKKAALITGGSRGIGRAIALKLAADGYHAIVNYRANDEAAQETVRRIEAAGGSAELCRFDLADRAASAAAVDGILSRHTVRVLVFNAGIRSDQLLVFMEQANWDAVLDVNLRSFFTVVKPVVKQMALARDGRIIVVSSTSGEAGMAGQTNYAAAKAGLIGAVKSLSLECARRGVLVNAVAPGFIKTDMIEGVDIKDVERRVPLGRVGTPDEVASVVSFLASSGAGYITGQTIRVNGGMYL
jgi:3-oxoacyl-[acyl-carrier protein] reductase